MGVHLSFLIRLTVKIAKAYLLDHKNGQEAQIVKIILYYPLLFKSLGR